MLAQEPIDDQLPDVSHSRYSLDDGAVLGEPLPLQPMQLRPIHSLSSFLDVGRDSTHSSLPASTLFLRLAPCGSSGEYFSGATATITPPHSAHSGPKPNALHALQRWSFVLAMISPMDEPLDGVHEVSSLVGSTHRRSMAIEPSTDPILPVTAFCAASHTDSAEG